MASLQPNSSVPRTRPSVFVGSSSEGRPVARAIQFNLNRDQVCETTIWDQGVIRPTEGTLEGLSNRAKDFDFAIIVLTPDDIKESRGQREACPRDNLLVETGLFVGAVGRLRTFLVVDSTVRMSLPTDLAGVTCSDYRPPNGSEDLRSASAEQLRSALGPACDSIEDAIRRQGPRTAAGPIPRQVFKDLVEVLAFAKSIHTSFQVLDTSHLDSLSRMVYDLVSGRVSQASRKGKCLDCNQAWNRYRYSAQFVGQGASLGHFLERDGWDRLDSALGLLKANVSPDLKKQMEICATFCGSIKDLLPKFMEAQRFADSLIGREGLIELLNWPGQDQKFWDQVNRLSTTAKSLITTADAIIVNIVDVITIEQVTR